MKEKFTFQQKTKLLTKLFDAGCNTEKKLQQLDMESILKIPGITIQDKAHGKSLRNRLLICIIGISPLPGTPPAP